MQILFSWHYLPLIIPRLGSGLCLDRALESPPNYLTFTTTKWLQSMRSVKI